MGEARRGAGIGESLSLRGFVPERIVVSIVLDPYMSIKALAAYSNLSVRRLRQLLDLPPNEALPCFRVGSKILVRRSEFDVWMEQFKARGRPSLAKAMQEMGLS